MPTMLQIFCYINMTRPWRPCVLHLHCLALEQPQQPSSQFSSTEEEPPSWAITAATPNPRRHAAHQPARKTREKWALQGPLRGSKLRCATAQGLRSGCISWASPEPASQVTSMPPHCAAALLLPGQHLTEERSSPHAQEQGLQGRMSLPCCECPLGYNTGQEERTG